MPTFTTSDSPDLMKTLTGFSSTSIVALVHSHGISDPVRQKNLPGKNARPHLFAHVVRIDQHEVENELFLRVFLCHGVRKVDRQRVLVGDFDAPVFRAQAVDFFLRDRRADHEQSGFTGKIDRLLFDGSAPAIKIPAFKKGKGNRPIDPPFANECRNKRFLASLLLDFVDFVVDPFVKHLD